MNDKTEQSLADALRCTAAGGRAEIINVPGYPLMVRAVDYNTLRADLDRAIVNFGDAAATVCDMRAQLAEAQRELIAKEAERAGLELERNNAQRQHTMQCAINKTDSQRILELTAENERLREQRNRVGLYIDRALNGGRKDDHEAGLSGRMDAIRALRAQLAEVQDALQAAQRLFKEALPKFNWGASFLDANAIQLLNEVPEKVNAAIDAAKGQT